MKGLRLLGDVIFEYLIITLILILSICLVIPFIPVFVGVIAYLRLDINTRTLRDFWMGIKENIKILIPYSIFELTILAFSILNLYFFLTHPEKKSDDCINFILYCFIYRYCIFHSCTNYYFNYESEF